MVFYCPESPRWLMEKGRYRDAYKSLRQLRFIDSQAARDLCASFTSPLLALDLILTLDGIDYIDTLLCIENKIVRKGNRYAELFTIPRNRRATTGAFLVVRPLSGLLNRIAHPSSSLHRCSCTLSNPLI